MRAVKFLRDGIWGMAVVAAVTSWAAAATADPLKIRMGWVATPASLVPLLFALVMAWIVVSALRSAPRESIATLVLILLGLPLYPLFRQRRRARPLPPVTSTPAPRA